MVLNTLTKPMFTNKAGCSVYISGLNPSSGTACLPNQAQNSFSKVIQHIIASYIIHSSGKSDVCVEPFLLSYWSTQS